jgi:hypothetical protein
VAGKGRLGFELHFRNLILNVIIRGVTTEDVGSALIFVES